MFIIVLYSQSWSHHRRRKCQEFCQCWWSYEVHGTWGIQWRGSSSYGYWYRCGCVGMKHFLARCLSKYHAHHSSKVFASINWLGVHHIKGFDFVSMHTCFHEHTRHMLTAVLKWPCAGVILYWPFLHVWSLETAWKVLRSFFELIALV